MATDQVGRAAHGIDARRTFRNQAVRLADLAVTEHIIRQTDFENCAILGPAVVAPLATTSFEHNVIEGDADAVLWELAPGRESIIGAIGLENCAFRECRFSGIGFAGPPEFTRQMRASFHGDVVA